MTKAQAVLTNAKLAVESARKGMDVARAAERYQPGRGLVATARALLLRAEANAAVALRAVEAERVVSLRRAAEYRAAQKQRAA
jgi:hypothetical protein